MTVERRYLDLQRPGSLKEYNSPTYQKLRTEGRQQPAHPLDSAGRSGLRQLGGFRPF